ncbi:MAG: hypothetical protein ACRCSO_11845 [Sphingomonas sp.]
MILLASLFLAIAPLQTAPAVAPTDPAAPEHPVKPKKARKICRAIGASGTHMQSTICKTEAEWAEIDAHSEGGFVVHRTQN